MKGRNVRISSAPVLALALLFSSCATSKVATNPAKPRPVLDQIAIELANVESGAKLARTTNEAMLAQAITEAKGDAVKIAEAKARALKVTHALQKLQGSLGVIKPRVAGYATFDIANQQDFKRLMEDLKSGYADLKTAGILGVSTEGDQAMQIINAAMQALLSFIPAPPPPTPVEVKKVS